MLFTTTPSPLQAGALGIINIELETNDQGPVDQEGDYTFVVSAEQGTAFPTTPVTLTLSGDAPAHLEVVFTEPGPGLIEASRGDASFSLAVIVESGLTLTIPDARVALVAADAPPSEDAILWTFIKQITEGLRFNAFHEFVLPRLEGNPRLEWFGNDAFRQLQRAAEEFVRTATDPIEAVQSGRSDLQLGPVQAGVARSYVSSEGGDLAQPFLRSTSAASTSSRVTGAVQFPLANVPFVELIWNYWLEEAGLVQTFNHVLARFQNRRISPRHDPLARFDLSPLLPLRNLLWGYADTEVRRLTVRRRAAEYQYQYGLVLLGRAVPPPSMMVEQRTQFLEAFHALLNASYAFFKERDDKTVDADAFPLLSNLREVHLVLSRGAHNQFADLAFVARAEMLAMQWILAKPEMREFLGGPTMVPYDEPWMDRVDTMKSLQGWSEASISHFFELATYGEQIVLSIRHGRWNEAARTREDAANWALTWRNQIQRYVHAYRTVTGVDLATTVNSTMPSMLIARRLQRQLRA